jgi:hypothetical protein
MKVFRVVLCAIAALSSAELLLVIIQFARDLSSQRATGLTAVMGQFVESFFSPIFWLLAILFFFSFRAASRLNSKSLRILFFWTPTVVATLLTISLATFFTFLLIHYRAG